MITSFVEIGKEMVRGDWGKVTEKQLYDLIKSLDEKTEILCVLSYIAQMLRPISEVAQWQIDAKEKERQAKVKKRQDGRKLIAKPVADKLNEMGKLSDDEAYHRVLRAIRHYIWSFVHYEIDSYLDDANEWIEKPIAEWQEKELLRLNGIGKKRLADFLEWRKSQP